VDTPERQESHGVDVDKRVGRGLGFLSWLLPKGLK